MQDNLLNILSDNNKDIDNQKLMDYISGKLSAEQKHEVEKLMADNAFLNEAIEGLQQAGKENSILAAEQLNKQLRSYLQQRKKKREKKLFPVSTWTYVAVIFILIVAIIVYAVIKLKA